jgi:hypothetical protein
MVSYRSSQFWVIPGGYSEGSDQDRRTERYHKGIEGPQLAMLEQNKESDQHTHTVSDAHAPGPANQGIQP